jgi:hypothetical protein
MAMSLGDSCVDAQSHPVADRLRDIVDARGHHAKHATRRYVGVHLEAQPSQLRHQPPCIEAQFGITADFQLPDAVHELLQQGVDLHMIDKIFQEARQNKAPHVGRELTPPPRFLLTRPARADFPRT